MAKTQTQERRQTTSAPPQQGQANMTRSNENTQMAVIYEPRLPYHPAIEQRFGVDKSGWKVLCEARFPTATSTDAIILALAYCRARNLDIFKAVIHIVPIWNKQLGRMVDTIWPGIGELRTTAHRTNAYAGHDDIVLGPTVEAKVGDVLMRYPEWAQMTAYRFVQGARCAFPGPKVYWIETYATLKRDDDSPNEMWRNRPIGQIQKCAEAAALRSAFPEELGSDYIPEEIERGAVYGAVTQKSLAEQVPAETRSAALVKRLQEQDSQTQDAVIEQPRPVETQEREPGSEEVDEKLPPTSEQIRARINISTTADQLGEIDTLIRSVEPESARNELWHDVELRRKELDKLNGGDRPKGTLV